MTQHLIKLKLILMSSIKHGHKKQLTVFQGLTRQIQESKSYIGVSRVVHMLWWKVHVYVCL